MARDTGAVERKLTVVDTVCIDNTITNDLTRCAWLWGCQVGREVFNNCIAGELSGRTRVLVTNQLQFLRSADQIVFMLHGRMAEVGTYTELQAKEGLFAQMMKQAEASAPPSSDPRGRGGKSVLLRKGLWDSIAVPTLSSDTHPAFLPRSECLRKVAVHYRHRKALCCVFCRVFVSWLFGILRCVCRGVHVFSLQRGFEGSASGPTAFPRYCVGMDPSLLPFLSFKHAFSLCLSPPSLSTPCQTPTSREKYI